MKSLVLLKCNMKQTQRSKLIFSGEIFGASLDICVAMRRARQGTWHPHGNYKVKVICQSGHAPGRESHAQSCRDFLHGGTSSAVLDPLHSPTPAMRQHRLLWSCMVNQMEELICRMRGLIFSCIVSLMQHSHCKGCSGRAQGPLDQDLMRTG